jgi:proline iminopeptidase
MSVVEHVEVPGASLYTIRAGEGPPLIWCHGGPGLWDYLGPLAALTSDHCTTYRYDQRGCGRSTGDGPHTVAQNVADLEALRAHFGCDRWIVAGHSWGALLALAYAEAQPEHTTALIYLSAVGTDAQWRRDFEPERQSRLGPDGVARLAALKARWEAEGTLAAEREYCALQWSIDFADTAQGLQLAQQVFEGELQIDRAVQVELWEDAQRVCLGPEAAARARQVLVPTLVLHGDRDVRPAWPARALAASMPHARFVLLEGAGHFPWVERAEALRAELVRFIEEMTAS